MQCDLNEQRVFRDIFDIVIPCAKRIDLILSK